jgi:SOS-response transcriptional repressor LexA
LTREFQISLSPPNALTLWIISVNAFSCNALLADNAFMDIDNLKTRLAALLQEKGITETQAAKMANTSQSTLHRVITGEIASPRAQTIEKIAKALDVSYSYLVEGDSSSHSREPINQNTLLEQQGIPLIEWQFLESGIKVSHPLRIMCPIPHGPKTFATRVNDNTMTGQYGRSYPEGSIIFIDPERVDDVKNGDRVYAMIEGTIPTFKQFGNSDGQRYLQSINLQYPIITREFNVIGLVIGMWTPEY